MSEPKMSKRPSDADDQRSTKRVKGFKEPPRKKQQRPLINSKTPNSSRTPPKNDQNGVPGRSSSSETQIKDGDFSICGHMDLRLKPYVDRKGEERLFMGVASHGRLCPNMMSPVRGLNSGIAMGTCSLGSTSALDAAVSMAWAYSEHRYLPHMPQVFFLVAPIVKLSNGEEGTLSSRYDRILLSSSQQHINLPPKMSRDGDGSDSDMLSHSNMERLIPGRDQAIREQDQSNQERNQVIQERDQAIQERDQAIQERNAFNKVVQTGNPYIGHNPVELVGRYASSERHALLCNGFMRKWEVDSSECRDKLEKATDLSARHAVIKASLDDIYQISQDFDAQAKWMSARHTSRPL